MTDEQFDQIIALLTSIRQRLDGIETNTGDISYVQDNTSETVDLLKEIKESMVN